MGYKKYIPNTINKVVEGKERLVERESYSYLFGAEERRLVWNVFAGFESMAGKNNEKVSRVEFV